MLFGDMNNKFFDKLGSRNSFNNKLVIFVTIVVKDDVNLINFVIN